MSPVSQRGQLLCMFIERQKQCCSFLRRGIGRKEAGWSCPTSKEGRKRSWGGGLCKHIGCCSFSSAEGSSQSPPLGCNPAGLPFKQQQDLGGGAEGAGWAWPRGRRTSEAPCKRSTDRVVGGRFGSGQKPRGGVGGLFPAPVVKGVAQKQQAGPSPKAGHQKPLGIERQGALSSPLLSWPRSQERALEVLRSKSFIKNKSSESIYKLRLRGRCINFGRRNGTLPSPLLGMVEGRGQAWRSQEAPAPVGGREGWRAEGGHAAPVQHP